MSDKALALDADVIAAYSESIEMFVRAHLTIAESGGQMIFDVAPGGLTMKVNTIKQHIGNTHVGDWSKVKAKIRARSRAKS